MCPGDNPLASRKDRLWKVIRWLDEQGSDDAAVVAEACRRFDLSPADEDFVRRMWKKRKEAAHSPERGETDPS